MIFERQKFPINTALYIQKKKKKDKVVGILNCSWYFEEIYYLKNTIIDLNN